jgi:phospholipase D1/2
LTPERVPSDSGDDTALSHGTLPQLVESTTDTISSDGTRRSKESKRSEDVHTSTGSSEKEPTLKPKRSTKGVEPFEKWERDEMEKLLKQLRGHLGLWLGYAFQVSKLTLTH